MIARKVAKRAGLVLAAGAGLVVIGYGVWLWHWLHKSDDQDPVVHW